MYGGVIGLVKGFVVFMDEFVLFFDCMMEIEEVDLFECVIIV